MKKETLELILKAFKCVSKDLSRTNIRSVALDAAPVELNGLKEVRIRATQGHSLSEVLVEDIPLWDALSLKHSPYSVTPEAIPLIKAMLKDKRVLNFDVVVCQDHSIEVSDALYRMKLNPDYSFPETKDLWPNYQEEPFQVHLNPELLLGLYQSMNEFKGNKGVTLVIKDKLSPILVTCGDQKGLLMPMRHTFKEYCPKEEKAAV